MDTDGGEEEGNEDEAEGVEAAWDVKVNENTERVLTAMERLEREEERRARRQRMDRDQKELEEKGHLEGVNGSAGGGGTTTTGGGTAVNGTGGSGSGSATGTPASGTPVGPGTPAGGDGVGPDGKPKKEKKRKREGPGVAARNMSEDVRKKLSDQTALRSVGGRSFSWLSGGAGGLGTPTPASKLGGGTSNGLPKPKFAPQPSMFGGGAAGSKLPPPSFLPSSNSLTTPARLSGVPTLHDKAIVGRPGAGLLEGIDDASLDESKEITMRDALFAVEKERCGGAGRGSGDKVVAVAYARGRRREGEGSADRPTGVPFTGSRY